MKGSWDFWGICFEFSFHFGMLHSRSNAAQQSNIAQVLPKPAQMLAKICGTDQTWNIIIVVV